jgi:hypothetical protein
LRNTTGQNELINILIFFKVPAYPPLAFATVAHADAGMLCGLIVTIFPIVSSVAAAY